MDSAAFGGLLPSDQAAAQPLYSLGAKLSLFGAMLLVLVKPRRRSDPRSRVGLRVILSLSRIERGGGHRRQIEVLKVRGTAPLVGVQPLSMDDHGPSIYPRLKSDGADGRAAWDHERAPFGRADIDGLLGGGPNVDPTTLAAGTPGLRKTSMFGMPVEATEASGLIKLLSAPRHDLDSDTVAWHIREYLKARNIHPLVIDSATELEGGLTSSESRRVDVPTIVGTKLSFAGTPLVVFTENLLLLSYAEFAGELYRLFSVPEMRFSDFDRALYSYAIVEGEGIHVIGPARRAAGLLTGPARPLSTPPPLDRTCLTPASGT